MRKNNCNEEFVFFESGAAALSLKSTWTKLASTYGCMEVSLSHLYLKIKPGRGIGWLIKPLNLDLNHTIPISEITSVEKKGSSMGYREIRISFRDSGYEEREIILYIRKHEDFLTELDKLGIS